MRRSLVAAAVLFASAAHELPRPVECPPAKQKEVALTLVRLRDGQLMQWRPTEGRAALSRKRLSGE